jgi:hypothetical protein
LGCTASEVAAIVEGAMHHGTTMAMEGNYVDSHGQSEISFDITRLLGFDLLPRIKRRGPGPSAGSAWPRSAARQVPAAVALVEKAPEHHQNGAREASALIVPARVDGSIYNKKVKRVGYGFSNFANYRTAPAAALRVIRHTHQTARLRGSSPRLVA